MPGNELLRPLQRNGRLRVVRDLITQGDPVFHPDGPQLPPGAGEALLERARRRVAEAAILGKWNELGGAPGTSVTPAGQDNLVKIGSGYVRDYQFGSLYYPQSRGVFWVYGAIGDRYRALGGTESWLGWPTSDETDFTEGGRANTFANGAIYWWPDAGAIELGEVDVHYTGPLTRCTSP